ncbi:hypothetical protein SAMN05444397_109169 [Flavobacterium aquidurense]|uniref:Histidine kinase-, DNA gyrase B-, and HSP90-like ATPase n=1 Tax=Flavobacterium frigidimaris TaxID=262320 RepID=A0ABX4BPI8_FLAFR|nr:hypothetical protein [Flavobacterium frigidimaris]OXA78661.1 hypothetical protein B0A65_13095 [Flavobacterium frigidimaris]SDZ58147.1 hypothetical protein SAMN05444397_109169 [Flavobacterium aquidurense]
MDIKIKKNISFEDIDLNYKILNKFKNVNLVISKDLQINKFGIQSELILLFITWFRKSNGKLILNTKSIESSALDDFVNKHYNFSIITLAFNRGIYNLDKLNISNEIVPFIKRKLNEIESNLFWGKGDHSYIIALQKSLNPYPKAFYHNGKLKSKADFENLASYLISISIQTKNLSNKDDNRLLDSLPVVGQIVYELIENTHYWSLTDFNNEEIGDGYGLRNLLISNHHGDLEELVKGAKDDDFFSAYLSNLKNQGYSNIVEISVIDSGCGLASKYSNKAIENFANFSEVYDEIQNCLVKFHSSEKESPYTRGFGLHTIMELLSEKTGYLKLRTNGLKLYRDFNKNKFEGNNYVLDNYFENEVNYNFKKYLNEGTLFTFFIPLK